MQKLLLLGELVFDYVILTLYLLVSAMLVIPFVSALMTIMVFAHTQTYRSMLTFLQQHVYPLLWISVITFLLVGLLAIQVQWLFDPNNVLSYLLIGLLGILLTLFIFYPPVILYHMRVSIGQLITNILLVSVRQFKSTVMMLFLTVLMIYILLSSLYAILLLVPYVYAMSYVAFRAVDVEIQRKGNAL